MKSQLQQARRATHRVALAAEKRNEAIRQAHQSGATIRAIAEATGLSSARIHQILHGR